MNTDRVVLDSLPFAAVIPSNVTHAKHILDADLKRASRLMKGMHPNGPKFVHEFRRKHHGHGGSGLGGASTGTDPTGTGEPPANNPKSVDVTDAAVTYLANVGVGNPVTNYKLLIDTGSSNTWLGALTSYKKTSTSKDTRNTVNVSYGSGSFTGSEFIDRVTLSPNLVIEQQSIGVSHSAQGFNDTDGILGIGPVALTQGTVSNTDLVPTVTDNLLKQGTITEETIGISYVPTTSTTELANGELTFGAVDPSKFTGEIGYVPITSSQPASHYWGIDQSISYGGQQIMKTTAGIVDTGTTLLLLATDSFNAYQKATGAKMDQSTGLLTVTEEQFGKMQSLMFNIGGTQYELTPNAQIWPRNMNSQIGGQEGTIYLVTADMGSSLGQGLDFIDGFVFLQRFYSVYDTSKSQVGLANTEFTQAETN